MNYLPKSILLATSLALISVSPGAFAGEYEEGYANGLHALEDKMREGLGGIDNAIDENAAGIAANSAAIDTNSQAINANSTAIGANGSAIDTNSAAITALQAGEPTYDYRDYAVASNIFSKTYNIRNLAECDAETRYYDSVTTGDVTDVTMRRVRTVAGSPCRYHVFKFQATPEGYFRTGFEGYNRSGSTLNTTITLDSPVLRRSSSMKIGQQFADATSTTFVDTFGGPLQKGTYVEKSLLVGIESVTVPYNGETKIDGCLKFHVFHEASIGFGTGLNNRIEWHCPGIGMVKRIQGAGQYWELSNITYTP